MKYTDEHIDYLILGYANQDLTPEENKELLKWVEQDTANRNYFIEQTAILKSLKSNKERIDINNYFTEFKKRISPTKTRILPIKQITIAASVAILISLIYIFHPWNNRKEFPIKKLTSYESVSTYKLEDHTIITLAENSILEKPVKFNEKSRIVWLKGKAFFEVARDISRPFEVFAGEIEIKVLGTSFEVDMDTILKTVKISVSEGEVLVNNTKGNFSKKLQRGEQITITQEGKLLNQCVLENDNHLAWKTGNLVFKNAAIKNVCKELTSLYKKEFIIEDKEIEGYTLTTKIDSQSIAEVKLILQYALDIDVEELNDTIFISRKQ